MKRVALVCMMAAVTAVSGWGAFLRLPRLRGAGGSTITLRKRLHVNTLITEPGTVELDWSGLYSFSQGNYTMPAAFKYSPQGPHVPWGRTEYSVAFDSLTTADYGGGRVTQFSQTVTLAATAVVHDGEKLDIAIAPQAVFFLRDESGARLGAIAIARYDTGRNSMGATVSWSGATHSSATNPAATVDVGFGFGRQLQGSRLLAKLTPHGNVVWERSTGVRRVVSAFEGVEYQATERVAFDLSGQHFGAPGGGRDHQVVFGMTVSLGRVR
ncbi:MAG: hypothetical protein IT167_11135 [Bryobacterales bacterium]|nr:hypothetical protein [Bryobacterales bacterium]